MTFTIETDWVLVGVGALVGIGVHCIFRLFVPSSETEKWRRLHAEEVNTSLQADRDYEKVCREHRKKNEQLQNTLHTAECDRDDWKDKYAGLKSDINSALHDAEIKEDAE